MTLIFNIEYRTSWGEEVRVLGSIPELGNNQPNKATPLHTVDGIHWTAEVDIQIPGNGSVEYSYHIYRDGRTIRTEWNSLPRILHVADNPKKVYRIEDCWKNLPEQQYFYTSAFTESAPPSDWWQLPSQSCASSRRNRLHRSFSRSVGRIRVRLLRNLSMQED